MAGLVPAIHVLLCRPCPASHNGGVIAGLSRPKDGVASLAYDPAIHEPMQFKAALR